MEKRFFATLNGKSVECEYVQGLGIQVYIPYYVNGEFAYTETKIISGPVEDYKINGYVQVEDSWSDDVLVFSAIEAGMYEVHYYENVPGAPDPVTEESVWGFNEKTAIDDFYAFFYNMVKIHKANPNTHMECGGIGNSTYIWLWDGKDKKTLLCQVSVNTKVDVSL